MPAITVRPTATSQAVFTGDDDWEDVVRGWMSAEGAPADAIDGYMAQFREGVEGAGLARPWLLSTEQGIGIANPTDFVKHFEDVAATDVLGEIFQEMKRHAEKGFDVTHDDGHNTAHFVEVIGFYLNPMGLPGNTLPDEIKRQEFIKAASVAVAAVNKIDRAKNVGTFAV